ncbi:hypothetical protein AN191_08895 [Loktanella sp. 5RATIMAR09]|uniref:hypothetical protein n=1 Tax=Loktanella sp. 5RATIMAR09 TaxID=1225655 RepID=UPI0006EBAD68|nr:hypothetical protein [Loktanella sp. 5RATIMAR09]KQI72236.1 hypothetical protein AN191_08895 [Loktanella sp. 5RATIMAR09]
MKIPFTLRFAYYSFRAFVRAGLLLLCAWIFLIPATAEDITALGAPEGQAYPVGLQMMRAAKVFVVIAPPRAYDMLAMGLPQDIPPVMVRLALMQMAAGNVLPASTRVSPTTPNSRDIEGPRFIQVD